MRSTFFGFEIGQRGIQVQQRALDIVGHNIANANTPGFSRQDPILATTSPAFFPGFNPSLGPGQIGTGVGITEIRRVRDGFLDIQVRNESKSLGYWKARQDALQKIEVIFNEPSDHGLCSVFEQFWKALEELSNNPESVAVRSVVQQRGIALAETFNHIDRQLQELQSDLNNALKVKVDEINSIGGMIADLNIQILRIENTGQRANDLRDKRDLLIDQLAGLINIQIREDEKGLVQINIGNQSLVQGEKCNRLITEADPDNDLFFGVYWETNRIAAQIDSGTVCGLIETRGYIDGGGKKGLIRELREQLDQLAAALIKEFNAINSAGVGLNGSTGINFFVGSNAASIALSPEISSDSNKIAAASKIVTDPPDYTWNKGDGSNALLLAQLKQKLTIILPGNSVPTSTFEDFYRSTIGQIGVLGQEANRMVDNQELLLTQLDNNRLAVSGVSLDEEMVNMVRYQHAYNAAARFITTMDEMLDLVINRMGLVGR